MYHSGDRIFPLLGVFIFKKQILNKTPMKTISVIRRENLLKLEEKYGGLGQLNEKIGRDRSDSILRQIRSRVRLKNGYSREMGDAVARELESKLGWKNT